MPDNDSYYAHGKLLLTGEYLILKGAEGLALPLKLGQKLKTSYYPEENILHWKAYKPGGLWFEGKFDTKNFTILETSDEIFSEKLKDILLKTKNLNTAFLERKSITVETILEFDPQFGFGSSSTLIVNIARWAKVDPFMLQKLTFKGSGYDIAAGMTKSPIVFSIYNETPKYKQVNFLPPFAENLFFVYLGKKQKSFNEVQRFIKDSKFSDKNIQSINTITKEVLTCQSLEKFEYLMIEHENILSEILKTTPVRKKLFSFYKDGVIKSLGAWGGDFVLVTSKVEKEKFIKEMNNHGFTTVFSFKELILY